MLTDGLIMSSFAKKVVVLSKRQGMFFMANCSHLLSQGRDCKVLAKSKLVLGITPKNVVRIALC